MPYNTSTTFPPVGNPVYRIDTNWCMGDSLLYINANFFNLDSRTDTLSTNVLSLSSQFKSLSGLSSQTIALRYNNRNDTLSGEVLNNSLGTIKLGGDILQSGRALLTAVSLSALRDINFTTLNNNEALLWSSSNNRWENRPIVLGAGASIAAGDYGEIKIVSSSNWQVQSSSTVDSIRAITTDHIKDNAVTEAKIASNAVTEAKINSNAVTEPKIASNAVTETKIASNAVTEPKIASNAVTETKIASNAVTPTKLSTGAPVWNTLGNVGIGTVNPNQRLTVLGNISATNFIVTTSAILITQGSTNIFEPRATFHLSVNDTTTYISSLSGQTDHPGTLLIDNRSGTNGTMAQLVFRPRGRFGSPSSRIVAIDQPTAGPDLAFCCGDSEVFRAVRATDNTGRIGIGTTEPTATLHVNGSVFLSGSVGINTNSPNTELHVKGIVTANRYIPLEDYAVFTSLWG